MKLLAIIIQNRKGENLFVITSNNMHNELALRYSTIIYDYCWKVRNLVKRIEKPIYIDNSLVCLINPVN